MIQVSTGDAGWDVFCLAYKVDSPISTVFTEESLVTYLRVFNFLWRVKRMEYILSKYVFLVYCSNLYLGKPYDKNIILSPPISSPSSNSIWINQMADSRKLLRSRGPVLTEMSYVIHLSQVITTEMVHFIGQLQYYITFEVLECSWDALLKKVELLALHSPFLSVAYC